MLNKLLAFIRQYDMIAPGDHVICAVSGGADSVALLFAMYLLKDKLDIQLSAAHFNHHLRGEESDRDEAFVRSFCDRYDIPLDLGGGEVTKGKKGLEAAARDARYAFLRSLPGKIATAHTADDNTETVLMHMVRGTGLKGLGGIAPVNGSVIRPMLAVTRQDVEAFNAEWSLKSILDSSNDTDAYLRNRLRHHVIPLLAQENPCLAENVSAMALRLRRDEEFLMQTADQTGMRVETLRNAHPAIRSRALEHFLKESGVREPESAHIAQAEALVFSEKPSARAHFPGGVTIARNYGALEVLPVGGGFAPVELCVPGTVEVNGLRISCRWSEEIVNTGDTWSVLPEGPIIVRPRASGDSIRLNAGTKSLKKLFIDRKIPAARRDQVPVIADDKGVLAVSGIGANLDRMADTLPAVQLKIEEKTERNNTEGN